LEASVGTEELNPIFLHTLLRAAVARLLLVIFIVEVFLGVLSRLLLRMRVYFLFLVLLHCQHRGTGSCLVICNPYQLSIGRIFSRVLLKLFMRSVLR